jgi:TANFOR domain-containing protein
MKNTLRLLGLFCLLLFQTAQAQDVIVTVQVTPPYSTYLPDYLNNPSKIIFSLLSPRDADVKIRATITGDNGISVNTSPSGSAATPIHLVANQIKMMNGTALKAYLDVNSVVVTGIDKNSLYRGNGLPEGNYTVCLQVLDYRTGEALSQPAPTGCSAPIQIQQINPPQLIAPVCDETIVAGNLPQNMVFTWLPAPGVKPGTQYRLKIVELVPITRNPNEAMNSATTPAFFETTVGTFSYLYGPAQPALKDGKKYAWRVTAVDPLSAGIAAKSNFQNNGNSEVCSFTYKKQTAAPVVNGVASYGITLVKPIKGEKINSGYGLEFSWTASKKTFNNYELQFTDSFTQDNKISDWNNVPANLFSRPNSFMASKDVKKNLSEKLPGSWTNGKGKIAWRIIARDGNKKAIDSSKIEIYEVVDAPIADRIKLVSPIQGKQIVSGYGLKFQWKSSKKQSITQYQLQFTDRETTDKKISNWNNISDKLFSNKNAYFVSKDTKDLFVELPNSWTNGTGKIAWRVVGYSYGFPVDSSKIETYEIIEDKSDIAQLKALGINGYYVKINQIYEKNQDKFSASGTMYLWEGSKEINVQFKEMKIRPVSVNAKTGKKNWAAIQGEIVIDASKQSFYNKFTLESAEGTDGTFMVTLNMMTLKANLEGTMDETAGLFKPTKDSGTTEGRVKGKWFTNFFLPSPVNGNNMYEYESAETIVKMSFADKFDGSVNLKPEKVLEKLGNGKIGVTFGSGPGDMQMIIKSLKADLSLSGIVLVPNAAASTVSSDLVNNDLSLPFKNQKNLNFAHKLDNPVKWKLVKDGSVWANVTEMYVHLSSTGALDKKFEKYPKGLNFDKFGVTITLPQKPGSQNAGTMNMNFSNIYNKGDGYGTLLKNEYDTKSDVNISGFTSKLNKSDVLMIKNKLVYMYVKGAIYVPFINDWRPIGIDIDSEKIQGISVDFDYDKKYYLSKTGGEIYLTLSSGRLENNSIVISPTLKMSNVDRKGFETKGMPMCEIHIESTGAVSFNTNFNENAASVCQGTKYLATYYKFDLNVDKITISRSATKTDTKFMFSGDLMLAEGISSKSKKEAGFVYKAPKPDPGAASSNPYIQEYTAPGNQNYTAPKPNTIPKNFGGPAAWDIEQEVAIVENSIEITDDKKAVQGEYEDGGQKFGGGFKMVQNDPTWGDYFELGGYYETKEPSAKQLEMKFILGKKPKIGGYFSYWYFDFYQKGYVTIPVIPGIVEVSGFGGKAYYHMGVQYDNQGNVTSMIPDKSKSLGIAAIANVRTMYDQGMTVHGKATLVTQFQGWSIDGIDYYIKGDAIASNDQSNGLLQARMNGQLNWVEKYLDGHGQIWGNVQDLVCLNEGQANEDAVNFHFGADDFYINVGSKESPITAEILCGNGWSTGVWFGLDTNSLGLGLEKKYDSGWKGLDLGVASAMGRLTAKLTASLDVTYSPFQATGDVEFHGKAYGKGCVDVIGCIGGHCSADAKLTVSMPDPVLFKGSVRCDVSRWIPDFTLNASWSSKDGFDISL